MTIHDTEVLGPEELAELCAIFDDTWAAMDRCADSEWSSAERTRVGIHFVETLRAKAARSKSGQAVAVANIPPDFADVDGGRRFNKRWDYPNAERVARAGKLRNRSGFSHLRTLNFLGTCHANGRRHRTCAAIAPAWQP
jgi:hypothetical protein